MTSKAGKKKVSQATKRPQKPSPLSSQEVRAAVLIALSDEGAYCEMPTFHSSFDHLERQIDFNDILFGLAEDWTSCRVSKFDSYEWKWRYEISTKDIDEREFTIVISLDPQNNRFTIVTRWPND